MPAPWNNWPSDLPAWLIDSTAAGSVAVVFVLLARPVVRRLFGAAAAHALWGLVLLRVLLPGSTPWAPAWPQLPEQAAPKMAAITPVGPGRWLATAVVDEAAAPVRGVAPMRRPVVWLLWAGGAAGLGGMLAFRVLRTARLMRRGRDLSGDAVIAEFLRESGARVRVIESAALRSPALAGILRPTILLPPGWSRQLEEEDLSMVLWHEAGHWRRGDVLWQWAFEIVRVMQWYNPFIWFALRQARRDQESACDEWVLHRVPGLDPARYGAAVLNAMALAVTRRFRAPGHVSMAESRAGLEQRLRQLNHLRPRKRWAIGTALLTTGILLSFLAFGRRDAVPLRELPPPSAAPQAKASAGPERPIDLEINAVFLELPPDLAAKYFGPGGQASSPVLGRQDLLDLFTKFQQQPGGVDMVMAPKVATKPNHKASIRVVREFPYPTEFEAGGPMPIKYDGKDSRIMVPPTPTAFERRNIGIEIEVNPQLLPDGRILCEITPNVTEFAGFMNYAAGHPAPGPETDAINDLIENSGAAKVGSTGPETSTVVNQPVFSVRRMSTTVVMRDRETIVLGGISRNDEEVEDTPSGLMERLERDPMKGPVMKTIERILYVFVTIQKTSPPGPGPGPIRPHGTARASASPAPPSAVPAAPDKGNLPYGVPVPHRPGFVTSPFAPDKGMVDLRGYPPGVEVKDPYTGKLFRAP